MPPPSTTSSQNTFPTYRIRTMAGDIEAIKKGGLPEHKSVIIEKDDSSLKTSGETFKKIKPSFPDISKVGLKTDLSESQPQGIKPSGQPWVHAKPLTQKNNQPFNVPISKPMPPFEQKNDAPPPPGLPTAPTPPPIAPKPLTPPPARPMPPMPPIPIKPMPPSTPASLSLPPLPPLPKTTFPGNKSSSSKKMLLIAVLGAVLLIFIIGEIWWFFIRTPGSPPETTTAQNDILPPPQELQPLLPPEETQPTAINEPKLPASILSYSRTEIITASKNTPAAINTAIEDFDSDSVGDDELARLAVKAATPDNPDISEFTNLDDIVKGLGLKMPQVVRQNLSDDFNLFVFGANSFDKDECLRLKNTDPGCYGPRLGLAIKISNIDKIMPALKIWEKTMTIDLKPLIWAKTGKAASTSFLTGTYQEKNIHYKNLPLNTVTVEYAVAEDTLIIATSKNSMLKAIDSLNPGENSDAFNE